MRSEKHTIACSQCTSALSIEYRDAIVLPGVADLLTRLATYLKWDAEGCKCPVHAGKT